MKKSEDIVKGEWMIFDVLIRTLGGGWFIN